MNKVINNKNTVLRYIVPFYVENNSSNENYDALVGKINNKHGYVKGELKGEKDLYGYIYKQIGIDEEMKELGSIYEKKDISAYSELRYTSLKHTPEKVMYFGITRFGVYLFKMGVNFFYYDIELKCNYELEDVVTFQCKFKELAREEKDIKFERKCGKDKYEDYRGARVVHKELTSIFGDENNVVRYYCERIEGKKTKVADKPILFSYIPLVEEEELNDEHYKSAYYLASGYDYKYEWNKKRAENTFRPFNNIIWEISKEGCCGLSVVKNQKHYLYSDFAAKVKNDYFLLFLLVLHQAYVMLDFSNMIARELPADYESYDDGEGKLYETIKKIKLRLNVFLARNVYTSVSHIQHHNEFYAYAVRRLDIEHDIQSVSAGLGALEKTQQMKKEKYEQELREKEKIQQLQKEKREQEIKEKNSKKINRIAGLLTLINTISISLNLEKFIDEVSAFLQNRANHLSIGVIIKFGAQAVLWIIAMSIFKLTYLSTKNSNNKHKHNNDEPEERTEPNEDIVY